MSIISESTVRDYELIKHIAEKEQRPIPAVDGIFTAFSLTNRNETKVTVSVKHGVEFEYDENGRAISFTLWHRGQRVQSWTSNEIAK